MQLVFPDDEAIQPRLKLLAMAKRWKKGQDQNETSNNQTNNDTIPTTIADTAATTTTTTNTDTSDTEDYVPLPESRIDDEEMNDES